MGQVTHCWCPMGWRVARYGFEHTVHGHRVALQALLVPLRAHARQSCVWVRAVDVAMLRGSGTLGSLRVDGWNVRVAKGWY